MAHAGGTRLTAAVRGEQVLDAAVTAFATGGYAGTKTDEIARLAGVSQPYVIRLFGSKKQLFLATFGRVLDRIEEIFRAAGADNADLGTLGPSYKTFMAERDLLAVLMHGFAASSDPAIGDVVRERFGRIYTLIRELTGADATAARRFMSTGMLMTVFAAMQVAGPDAIPAPWATEMIEDLEVNGE